MKIFLSLLLWGSCLTLYGQQEDADSDSLSPFRKDLQQVVITGTMKAVKRTASPVPVEVYTSQFFIKNPSPALFDAMQMINGVRPQLNCNVCNTGDIHINGLEGPYTMVLIDGMPIVSSLASVYGLFGIPNALIERIEVVKGPASSLYGSEAMGGLINVITKNPLKTPRFFADLSTTSWLEHNADLGMSYRLSKKVHSLLGISSFYYDTPKDRNNDHFTDVTLQKRVSLFNKYSLERKENRMASLALRYIYEDRWGGEMNWNKLFRGTDSVYGEHILTSRFEVIGHYQLPARPNLNLSYSFNSHDQRSAYGNRIFNAEQKVAFGQLTWQQEWNNVELLMGLATKYTYYDDNTPATGTIGGNVNRTDKIFIPGIFIQQEILLNKKHRLLAGARMDHDRRHGLIFTPRFAYKLELDNHDALRFNAGTGFRVVNLFTEEHAALTGAREVIIRNALRPERSINVNLNYVKRVQWSDRWLNLDMSAWYTYFFNRIIPDYLSNPNQIIYDNLEGYSTSMGASINAEMAFSNRLTMNAGLTMMDVKTAEKDMEGKMKKRRQLFTEQWSGNWAISYNFPRNLFSIDYTGNVYGAMLLLLLSSTDPRPGISPVWSIQNIQFTKKMRNGISVYGGIKNLLNFTPSSSAAFIIARSHDPFDKKVQYDAQGRVRATTENPYALTFDPNYVYAPNQGIKFFGGMRLQLGKKK